MQISALLLVLVAIVCTVRAFPGGAPSGACNNLRPSAANHGQPQSGPNPYSIDLSPFDDGNGGYKYVAGATYTRKNYSIYS